MIDVLFFSDRDVKQKLFARVDGATRPLLVTQARTDRFSKPLDEREPFVSINRAFGDVLDVVIVADEGTTEGMWRDPVGDLADHFHPHNRNAAYAAATGYMVIDRGRMCAAVKKFGAPAEDLWFIQEVLAEALPGSGIPHPDPATRPGHGRSAAARPHGRPGGARHAHAAEDEARSSERPDDEDDARDFGEAAGARGAGDAGRRRAARPVNRVAGSDPWSVLGIPQGTPLADAKKAFRALIAQYHPDKVSHLAPEFQALAEQKTREILEAWQRIEEGEA